MVLAGLGVFTAASLVAGLAETGPVLLGGRAAQGVGAAMLSPAALTWRISVPMKCSVPPLRALAWALAEALRTIAQ